MRQEFLDRLYGRRVVKRPWEELRSMFEQVWSGKSDRLVRRASMMEGDADWTITRNKTGSVTITIKDPEFSKELVRDEVTRRTTEIQELIQSRIAESEGLGRPGISNHEDAGEGEPVGGKGLRGDTSGEWHLENAFFGPYLDSAQGALYELVNGRWRGSYLGARG